MVLSSVALTPDVHVSGNLIRTVVEVLQRRGAAPELTLGSSAATVFSELADRRVTLDEYQTLLRRAVTLSKDPAFGLHAGLEASDPSYGVMAPLVAHAQTLRHAIAVAARFHAILCDGAQTELVERDSRAQLRLKLHPAIGHEMTEMLMAGMLRLLEAFGCTGRNIHVVSFEYRRPGHARAYEAAFRGAERFASSSTGIELTRELLDRPHLRSQPQLHAVMRDQAERMLAQISSPQSYTQRVQSLLRNRGQRELPSITQAARELGLSERSLRRQLERESSTYRQLVKDVKHELACALLRDPDQTVKAIAHKLGFSCQASFHRSFARWTATTPVAYRAQK